MKRLAAERDSGDDFPAEEEEGCRPRGTGAESACLQSLTVQYLRGKISAEQFHHVFRKVKEGGKVEEAVVAKVARGMPEDKAWALMDAHRKWKRAERLNKESFKKSRRAKVISGRRANSGEFSIERGGEDDR